MINIRELITQLEKWEKEFGSNCEVSISYENLHEYLNDKASYPFVTGVSIVGQNEVEINFD